MMRCEGVLPDFEAMSLQEMLPLGCSFLLEVGMRPVFERMLVVDLKLSEKIVLSSLQQGPLTRGRGGRLHARLPLRRQPCRRPLVNDGFVSRVENPEDRRQKQLSLTGAGEELVVQLEAMMTEGMASLLAMLSPADQEQVRQLMARLLAAQAARLHPGDATVAAEPAVLVAPLAEVPRG